MLFSDFELDSKIVKAANACGFESPTPVQERAIPPILEGKDVLATAATGTGKTAAFLLPTMSRLLCKQENRKPGTPAILVLSPTRELAAQITRSVRDYGRFLRLACVEVVGGVPYREQLKRLRRPIEVIVATPGRLIDHMRNGKLDLSQVGVLILDEADRMLDMGFADDVKEISKACPHARQTLLFTATLDKRMEALAKGIQKDPVRISIQTKLSAPDISQSIYYADDIRHKRELLTHFLTKDETSKSIVFVATKREADKLARELCETGLKVGALHGDLNQGQRNRTLKRLIDNRLSILVATDVAARGIDVSDITHVINFDLPRNVEDYVHRIGRTGRAGKKGIAISLVGREDRGLVARIERFTQSSLSVETIEGLEPKLPIHTPARRSGPKSNNRKRPSGKGNTSKFRSAGRNSGDGRISDGRNERKTSEKGAGKSDASVRPFRNKPSKPRRTNINSGKTWKPANRQRPAAKNNNSGNAVRKRAS